MFYGKSLTSASTHHSRDFSAASAADSMVSLSILSKDLQGSGVEPIVAQKGAKLDVNNREIAKRVQEMRVKRDILKKEAAEEESECQKYEEQCLVVSKRITELTNSLTQLKDLSSQHEQVIWEAETAYNRLLESSRSLLALLGQESAHLTTGKMGTEGLM
jgi:sjoegren syndrome nuclear autoantigen 1